MVSGKKQAEVNNRSISKDFYLTQRVEPNTLHDHLYMTKVNFQQNIWMKVSSCGNSDDTVS